MTDLMESRFSGGGYEFVLSNDCKDFGPLKSWSSLSGIMALRNARNK